MQENCIFPGRYAPVTYYDWLRGASRNTLMARNAREICNFFAHCITDKANFNELLVIAKRACCLLTVVNL